MTDDRLDIPVIQANQLTTRAIGAGSCTLAAAPRRDRLADASQVPGS